jgi:gas vesicle protein
MGRIKMANNSTAGWVAGIAIAACCGIAIGMLLAPKSGRETREAITGKVSEKINSFRKHDDKVTAGAV